MLGASEQLQKYRTLPEELSLIFVVMQWVGVRDIKARWVEEGKGCSQKLLSGGMCTVSRLK